MTQEDITAAETLIELTQTQLADTNDSELKSTPVKEKIKRHITKRSAQSTNYGQSELPQLQSVFQFDSR